MTESLARPEGFEPPTLRSEVRSDAQLERTGKKKRPVFLLFSNLLSILLSPVLRCCGNIDGNKVRVKTRS
jgi:hypothetical protein